jgi:putative transposase
MGQKRHKPEEIVAKVDQLKRLKEFELDNKRLWQAVSDLTLDKQILAEVARGNC